MNRMNIFRPRRNRRSSPWLAPIAFELFPFGLYLLTPIGLVFCLLLSGCGEGGEDSAIVDRADAAVTDSAAATPGDTLSDSEGAGDSKGKSKAGILGRLFGRGEEEEEEEEAVPVELADVEVRDVSSFLGSTATLEPEKQAEVMAKIGGEIRKILVEEGDWVEEGDLLALLDGDAERVALEEADASVRALERDLQRTRLLHEQEFQSEKALHDALSLFEQADARRKGAQLKVDHTRIIAPFTGQIALRHVDRGQTVAPGSALFTIVDVEPLRAKIHLPENEAAALRPGQKVWIHSDRGGAEPVEGEILRIAPMVDSRTGTVKITCDVPGGGGHLRPGSFVRVRIETDTHEDVLVIPKRSLVPEGTENYVFKAVGDSVIKVPVFTSFADDTMIEVSGGLAEGERVVTVGQGALKSGSRVRPIEPGAERAGDK